MSPKIQLTKNQTFSLVFLAVLFFSLFVGLILVQQRQEIRPKASSTSVVLSLLPATQNFNLNDTNTFDLVATFTGGSSTEKIDGIQTEVDFSSQYLNIPANHYIITAQSGLSVLRVDGPTISNQNNKALIRLVATTPGSGPSTDKPIVVAKIDFQGIAATPRPQIISLGTSQIVNNLSVAIPVTLVGAGYTVGQGNITITPPGPTIRPVIPGQADFLLQTDSNSTSVGQTFTVNVSMKLTDSSARASGVDFILLYDKKILDVVNTVPNITTVNSQAPFTDGQVASGGSFNDQYNFVRVTLLSKKQTTDLPSGTINLAKVTFKGSSVGTATIKFPDDNSLLQVSGIAVSN
ncbi:cohesin domain-containing protein [Patescibacteria group bacterium]|nr:cohesin domain-containing protein [Patescibacteria group bacterium]